jgi:glycine/D-amino acid oxidase-like deaminating enzyme
MREHSGSWWHDSLPTVEHEPRPALRGDTDVDVVVVGAGYTGLWTAYALKQRDPSLRVAICEKEIAGFGASGRNGGWCSSFFAGSRKATERAHGRDAVNAMQRAMFRNLDEIEDAVRTEAIDCDWARGGCVHVATAPHHVERLHAEIEEHRSWGFGDDDYRYVAPDDARKIIGCEPNLGAMFTPHCAAIHPAKLARGLAHAVERMGVPIYEQTAVGAIETGFVRTPHGDVRADVVVRATEAFTVNLPGLRRTLVPVYSLMIATEPLPDAFWADAGLHERPTFTDYRHMIIYGQRTADNRFAFGGRGAPYHFASRIKPRFDRHAPVFDDLDETLHSLFPNIGPVELTHTWGGAVAIPRDWYPSVGYDRATGVAWGGGYVGDGVSTTHLAGTTIADLILGRDTDRTHLPWVGHESPQWEPEPLRWLGVNGSGRLVMSLDRAEANGKNPRRRTRLLRNLVR